MSATLNEGVMSSPWYSRAEHEWLYQKLFTGEKKDLMQALRRIEVWKARSSPRVPLGVEVTVTLIRALLASGSLASENMPATVPDTDVESMLCMALIRFVNLITEVGQVMEHPLSITAIADKMGVPEWIVDLRHSAAHSNLPSLDVLKTAAAWSLDWVKSNYWEIEVCHVSKVQYQPNTYQDVHETLCDLRDSLIKARNSPKELKAIMECFLKKGRKWLKNPSTSQEFLQVMMCNGFVFPAKQMTKFKKGDNREVGGLVNNALSLWMPLLKVLHSMGLIPNLMKALIMEGIHRPSTKGELAATWISHLLKKFSPQGENRFTDIKNRVPYKDLLKLNPNHIKTINSCLPRRKRQQLLAVAIKKLYGSWTRSTTILNPKEPPNLASSDRCLEKNEGCCPLVFESKQCPLGTVPSQYGVEILNVELPPEVDALSCNEIYRRDSEFANLGVSNIIETEKQNTPLLL